METKLRINRRKKQQEKEHEGVLQIIPKSVVMGKKKQSAKWWQREWSETTKGAITKVFFPKIEGRKNCT